jgi:APA family basic amino acid/polyamine antiporter
VGALFAFAGALSYSELGINFPSSGGEYVYLTHAFGPEWGFMTGWVSFFAGFSAPIAAAALAFSDYLGYFFPSLKQANATLVIGSGAFSLRLGAGQMTASALIAAFTILNCLGVGRTAKVQNVLTATKLIVIAGFVLWGSPPARELEPLFRARRAHLHREPAGAVHDQPAVGDVRV